MTANITGRTAITVAEMLSIPLRKYADPIVPAIEALTVEQAIALCDSRCNGDPSLVYVDAEDVSESVRSESIMALRTEAAAVSDGMQVAICRLALDRGGDVYDSMREDGMLDDLTEEQRIRLSGRCDARRARMPMRSSARCGREPLTNHPHDDDRAAPRRRPGHRAPHRAHDAQKAVNSARRETLTDVAGAIELAFPEDE